MQRLTALLACLIVTGPAFATATAIINVSILPMTGESVTAGQTVVVNDGLIVAIGDVDRVPIPVDAVVVDGTDRFLMPGLAEMHAHIPEVGSESIDRILALFVANGVTTVRGMLGRPDHLQLRQDLLDGRVFGPRLITSGPSMNGNSVDGPEDARRQVRAQHAAGYDFIKIHPGLSAEEFSAIAEVAGQLGMPFAGHVTAAAGLEGVLASGMATIDHLDGYLEAMMPADTDRSGGYGGFFGVLLGDQVDGRRIEALARATAAAGVWNVPTQSLFEHRVSAVDAVELANRPEMGHMPRETVQRWIEVKQQQLHERGYSPAVAGQAIEVRRKLILALHEAGAGLLLGSDAPQVFNVPGFSLHDELALLVAAGLTPYEALHTGTAAVADFLGSNTGTVEVGRAADLVLLDDNPLEDISNARRVHGVVLRGSWISGSQLNKRLAAFGRARD